MKLSLNHLLTAAGVVISASAFAQEVQPPADDLYTLSLEELMNVPINSASKKDETLFDAPLSSYTITRSDIDKSGATTIMEALRLAPGLIVREQANGVYDIHIRGMENLTRTNGTFLKTNSYTLVMIDNRPVFNHGLGGTYWESLSIDVNDVERIEIVRGPSSPLFGPNAVTGVINIITKRVEGEALVNANVQYSDPQATIANVSAGKNFGKFSTVITANFQDRERSDDLYYRESTGEYLPLEEFEPSAANRDRQYPDPSRSLEKWGVNGYFTYKATEQTSFDLSLSHQEAAFQKIWISNPLVDGEMRNTAVNLSAKIADLNVRTSYVSGYNLDNHYNVPRAEYDFNVADVVAEYAINFGDNYTVTPGLSYQTVTFDDRDYVNMNEGIVGLFNDKNEISTTAVYLRADLNFTPALRVLGGVRLDKFSDPDDAYLAYEFATTYKINANHLVRAAITRSNSGSFIGYNFLNIAGAQTGNTDLDLFTLNMVELGYRAQISSKFQLDIDVFQQKGENLTAILQMALPGPSPQQFANTPTTATQTGVTLSLNFVPSEKIQFKPFITIQETKTEDMPSVYLEPSLIPGFVTYSNSTHKYTPAIFGGFYFNYRPIAKLNWNLNGYYFGEQTQYDVSYDVNDTSTPQYAAGQIDAKFLLSTKLSYEAAKNLSVFANVRNIGAKTREFYAGDRTDTSFALGLSYNLSK